MKQFKSLKFRHELWIRNSEFGNNFYSNHLRTKVKARRKYSPENFAPSEELFPEELIVK